MAATLSSRQADRTLAEVRRLGHAGLDGVELLRRTATALRRTVPFTAYCAFTTDPTTGLITRGVAEGMDAPIPDADAISRRYFERVYFEEDLDLNRAMVRAGTPVVRLRDINGGQPESRAIFREVVHPFGFGEVATLVFTDKGHWGGMHLLRTAGDPDFSPADFDLIRTAAPAVGAGLRAATTRTRPQVEPDDNVPGVIVVDAAGRIASATPTGSRLLAELEPDASGWRNAAPLPIPVLMVLGALRQATRPESRKDGETAPRLRLRSRRGRWLSIHADLTEPTADRDGERVVVIAPARPADVAQIGLAAHGLSPREEEVVRLVVAGSSTRQMADRLFIAEHTVQRHLSNVFEKVGVRSRRELVKHLFVEHAMPGGAAGGTG